MRSAGIRERRASSTEPARDDRRTPARRGSRRQWLRQRRILLRRDARHPHAEPAETDPPTFHNADGRHGVSRARGIDGVSTRRVALRQTHIAPCRRREVMAAARTRRTWVRRPAWRRSMWRRWREPARRISAAADCPPRALASSVPSGTGHARALAKSRPTGLRACGLSGVAIVSADAHDSAPPRPASRHHRARRASSLRSACGRDGGRRTSESSSRPRLQRGPHGATEQAAL